MTNHKPTLHVPKSRLVRDAQRAMEVGRRHEGKDRTLDARAAALAPTAERFLDTKRTHEVLEEQASQARRERDVVTAGLHHRKMQWLPSVRIDLPDIDTSGVAEDAVAEDAVASSRTFRNRVQARLLQGAELDYAEQLDSELVSEEERVEIAAREAKDLTRQAEQARDEHHAAAVALDDQLIAFRATLRRVLGSTHGDYRDLRVRSTREQPELEREPELDATQAPEGEATADPEVA